MEPGAHSLRPALRTLVKGGLCMMCLLWVLCMMCLLWLLHGKRQCDS